MEWLHISGNGSNPLQFRHPGLGIEQGFDRKGCPHLQEVDELINQIPTLPPMVPGRGVQWGITLMGNRRSSNNAVPPKFKHRLEISRNCFFLIIVPNYVQSVLNYMEQQILKCNFLRSNLNTNPHPELLFWHCNQNLYSIHE